jgi:hypothetical protein
MNRRSAFTSRLRLDSVASNSYCQPKSDSRAEWHELEGNEA